MRFAQMFPRGFGLESLSVAAAGDREGIRQLRSAFDAVDDDVQCVVERVFSARVLPPDSVFLTGGFAIAGFDFEDWYEHYQAAVKVQRVVRGMLLRKQHKAPSMLRKQLQGQWKDTRRRVVDEENGERHRLFADFEAAIGADQTARETVTATKLQANYRGKQEREWVREAKRELRGQRLHSAALWIQSVYRGHRGRKRYRELRARRGLRMRSWLECFREVMSGEAKGRSRLVQELSVWRLWVKQEQWYDMQQQRGRQHPSFIVGREEDRARALRLEEEMSARFDAQEDMGREEVLVEKEIEWSSFSSRHGRRTLFGMETALRAKTIREQREVIRELRIELVATRVGVKERLGRKAIDTADRDMRHEMFLRERHEHDFAVPHARQREAVEKQLRKARRVVGEEEEREREEIRPVYEEARLTVEAAEERRWGMHYTARDMLRHQEATHRSTNEVLEQKERAVLTAPEAKEREAADERYKERLRQERCNRVATAVRERYTRLENNAEEEAIWTAGLESFLARLDKLTAEHHRSLSLRKYAFAYEWEIETEVRGDLERGERCERSRLAHSARAAIKGYAEEDRLRQAKWAREQGVVAYEESLPRKRVWQAEDFAWINMGEAEDAARSVALDTQAAREEIEASEQRPMIAQEAAERTEIAETEWDWFLPVIEAQEMDFRPHNEKREEQGRNLVLQLARIDAREVDARMDERLAEERARGKLEGVAAEEFEVASIKTAHRNAALRRLATAFDQTEQESRVQINVDATVSLAKLHGTERHRLNDVFEVLKKQDRQRMEDSELASRSEESTTELVARQSIWRARASQVAHWLGVHPGEEPTVEIRRSQLMSATAAVAEEEHRVRITKEDLAEREVLARKAHDSQLRARAAAAKRVRAAGLWQTDFTRAEMNATRLRKRRELAIEEARSRAEEAQDEHSEYMRLLWSASDRHRRMMEEQMAVLAEEEALRDALEDEEDERWDRIVSSHALSTELKTRLAVKRTENMRSLIAAAERSARLTLVGDEVFDWQRRYMRFRKKAARTFWAEALDAFDASARQIRYQQDQDRGSIVFRYTVRIGALASAPQAGQPFRRRVRRMPSIAPVSVSQGRHRLAHAPPAYVPTEVRHRRKVEKGEEMLSPVRQVPGKGGRYGMQIQKAERGLPTEAPRQVVTGGSKQAAKAAMERALQELSSQIGDARKEQSTGEYVALSDYLSLLSKGRPAVPRNTQRSAGPTQDEIALMLKLATREGATPHALREAIALWNDARGAVLEGRLATDNQLAMLMVAASESGTPCPAIAETLGHVAEIRSMEVHGRRPTMNELALLLAAGLETEDTGTGEPLVSLSLAAGAIGPAALGEDGESNAPPTPLALGALFAAGEEGCVNAAMAEAATGLDQSSGAIHAGWVRVHTEEEDLREWRLKDEESSRRMISETQETEVRRFLHHHEVSGRFAMVGQFSHLSSIPRGEWVEAAETRGRERKEEKELDARELLRRAAVRGRRGVQALQASDRLRYISQVEGSRGLAALSIQRCWRRFDASQEARAVRAIVRDHELVQLLSEEAMLASAPEVEMEEEAERGVYLIEEDIERAALQQKVVDMEESYRQAILARLPDDPASGLSDEELINRGKVEALWEFSLAEVVRDERAERENLNKLLPSLGSWKHRRSRRESHALSEVEFYEAMRAVVRAEMRGRLRMDEDEFSERSDVIGRWRTAALVASCNARAEDGASDIQILCRKISWVGAPRALPRVMETPAPITPGLTPLAGMSDPVLLECFFKQGGTGRLGMIQSYRGQQQKRPSDRPPFLLPAVHSPQAVDKVPPPAGGSDRLSRVLRRAAGA
eukprot:Hpha_TRINITY_DN13296_c0_g1::TRINITY_DN13296_c0_g1_i1::g.154459::m.154459